MASIGPSKSETSAPAEKEASGKGHGTLEILEIIGVLEKAGIPNCIVGVSALMYYGAKRVRDDWDICVPTELFEHAITFLNSKTFSSTCQEIPRRSRPEISLFDTYPRFKCVGVKDVSFIVVPAQAAHLHCSPSDIERSRSGLPYPTLPIFVQSVIDSRDNVALADAVDGMDLTEKWGHDHLELSHTDDAHWAKWANERMERVKGTANVGKVATNGVDRERLWKRMVEGKQKRGGLKYPKEHYATRFRRHGSGDPRLKDRVYV